MMMMMMMIMIMIKRIILLPSSLLLLLLSFFFYSWKPTSSEGAFVESCRLTSSSFLINLKLELETSSEGAFVESCRLTKYIYNFIHRTPLLWFNIILSYTVNENKPYTEKTKKVNL